MHGEVGPPSFDSLGETGIKFCASVRVRLVNAATFNILLIDRRYK